VKEYLRAHRPASRGPALRLVGRLHAELSYHDGGVAAGAEQRRFSTAWWTSMARPTTPLGTQYFAT
jgi:hypothetical protein